MANDKITIKAPRQGIAQSPHLGFGKIVNLDIFSEPGVVKLNNIMAKKSGTTVTGQINWMVRNPSTPAEIYALDSAGVVYKSSDSGATWAVLAGSSSTSAHGNGLAIWKNYLFVARDAYLDVCGDGSATGITAGNWSLGWQAIDSDVLWHPMIVSKNDSKLYGGAGQYVFSLDENTGQTFAPGTGATFTWTSQALDLPSPYRIKCMAELGSNLMMGTWQGTAVTDIRIGDVFPWDRVSVSFGQPIIFDEYGIHFMKNIGNSLVVSAGISGRIYRCDGVNAYIIGQIPQSVCDLTGSNYLETYPDSVCSYKGRVFFGVGSGGSSITTGGIGVWSISQTGQGNIMTIEHGISTGNFGETTTVKVSSLLPITSNSLLIAWRDGNT